MDETRSRPAAAATAEDSGRHDGAYLGARLRDGVIRIRGARQNNLRDLSLDIPTKELVVVTGVSGSGKSSLVFDTIYAEGQRRYVETFSAYARQFLDRMDKPHVDSIEGIPPAIAIDQTNPVRTSRSTVGTMTEINDHLKLMFARAASLFCRRCARPVRRDDVDSVVDDLLERARRAGDPRLVLGFPVTVPAGFGDDEVAQHLSAQGYTRVQERRAADDGSAVLVVVQDRLRAGSAPRSRIAEAVEAAFQRGHGRLEVFALGEDGEVAQRWPFSAGLHCANCDIAYPDPLPSLFSFNSPLGACETCRGFGRVIGIDLGLVLPDESLSLADGVVKPWQTASFKECQTDLERHARIADIPLDVPWRELDEAQRRWVIEGGDDWTGKWQSQWYGIRRFFDWLESKAYKMHIRVLLSKYRAYTPCVACAGARLQTGALLWRIGDAELAALTLGEADPRHARPRFMPVGVEWDEAALRGLPGLSIHDLMLLPIERVRRFFELMLPPAGDRRRALDEAVDMLLVELRARLGFLCDVGLGYLTLDRQSRTLSGGEVQRINLTTALGTSLVNTLFVLDEPSIGLHPRDMGRIIDVMLRLRDAGNSLLVVEHDPLVMFAADRLIDIGPGPGERGGRIVFDGRAEDARSADTLTGRYLGGRLRIEPGQRRPVTAGTPRLVLEGARAHNLRGIDVEIPLGRLVGVTGVSGSGKSTLVQNVLLPALLKAKGKPTEAPGEHARLLGDDWIADIVFVDQSPIGKTARSNPASYVGAFDPVRKLFAATSLARERGYTAGTFSFNAGDGRCPTCGGTGFEHVEMQFLSDVYLRCPDCDGRRFRDEVLELRIDGASDARRADGSAFGALSIANVLELTVSEALAFFRDSREVRARLQPLVDVGLDYLRLGQPVPTLSGGEAQRLKLAGFLAEAANGAAGSKASAIARAGRRGTLYIFDEPTTGLHFDDVARLLGAFGKLLDAGHSLLVIEHNLDVIAAADWLIDLGPEGGDGGGRVIATGTPDELTGVPESHTGRALLDYRRAIDAAPRAREPDRPAGAIRERGRDAIFVHHAREHNLKNIDVEIPRDALTVVTGVSGSGKSTLAFDVVFGEGQRRYLESLNAYARQFVQPASRPDIDGIFGVPPTVAIEQRTSRGGRKSTVATLTEIYHFLRLLYVKTGVQHCPDCGVPIEPQSFEDIAARILRDYRGRRIGLLAPLVVARKGVYTDLAKWAAARGFTHLRVDGRFLPTDRFPRLDRYVEHDIELPVADVAVDPANEVELRRALAEAIERGRGLVMVADSLDALAAAIDAGDASGASVSLPTRLFSTKRACASCGTSFPELDPRLFSFNSKTGWCTQCLGTGVRLPEAPKIDPRQSDGDRSSGAIGDLAERMADQLDQQAEGLGDEPEACQACNGERLNPVALAVRVAGLSIADATRMSIDQCAEWIDALELSQRDAAIAAGIVAEIDSRLEFLSEVGLGYLTLSRSAPTLSGGEAQRIRLAAQLGSNLQGVCYVLDEPSIGLHPRDNQVLLDTLDALRDKGNTLLVVEHDEDTIRRADHVIDMGPGAGRLGGRIIATGTIDALAGHPDSITGRMLRHPLPHPFVAPRPVGDDDAPWLRLAGAHRHNLRSIDVGFPLGRLSVVTGVSGSGKSTLARDVLLRNLAALVSARNQRKPAPPLVGLAGLSGWERVDRVLEVDQTPIGKTPRSCPATYVGFWDTIRRLFADTAEAKLRGWGPGRFSFNSPGGRCPACDGQGQQTIEMNFLPDVKVPCDACRGRRFDRETLEITWQGHSIGEVLAMSVDEAVEAFAAHPRIGHPLRLLQDVGLGYLTLGQPSPTLSGGEAQRIKLVTELAKVRPVQAGHDPALEAARRKAKERGRALPAPPHTVYVLDEPTVGLHMADVEKLIRVMHRLVDAGNTLVVVEHNLDIWAEADWIVDLGPGGGDAGGSIVGAAPVAGLVADAATPTAGALRDFLTRLGPPAG
ncbi:MAG: ATP-binding cassette domain-containing protein [Pseudomonadota bacterium]|nr:ATP-binding cassette domain-containing protein [Pseudomonadota bacterium]